jgi:hypothetical protein
MFYHLSNTNHKYRCLNYDIVCKLSDFCNEFCKAYAGDKNILVFDFRSVAGLFIALGLSSVLTLPSVTSVCLVALSLGLQC